MHPDKAQALSKLGEVTRELDSEIAQLKTVARDPKQNGWGRSLRAATTLPFLAGAAVLVDVLDAGLRRISDRRWDARRE